MISLMMNSLASPWIPAFVLLCLAVAARLLSRSWLAPSAFAALLWAGFVWISMLVTDYPVFASAIWAIVLFVFAIQLGAFIGEELGGIRVSSLGALDPASRQSTSVAALYVCVVCSIVALAGSIYFIFWSFSRFDLPPSPFSFLSLGHLWSVQRYEFGEIEPWMVRLTTMWVYPAALLGGIACGTGSGGKRSWLTFLPLLPALLVGSVVAARAGLLMALICWFSGYFAVKHFETDGKFPLFRRRLAFLFAALIAAGLALFLIVDVLRQSKDGQVSELSLDLQRVLKYSFGSLAAFSTWFHEFQQDRLTFGAYTFGGIFDFLGLRHRETGLYLGFVTLPGGEETNIYTAARGVIEDFSLPGSVLLSFGLSLVSGILLSRHRRPMYVSVLIGSAYYAFVLCSPLTSIFTYNGLVLAWLVAAGVLRSCYKRKSRLALFVK